MRWTDQMRADLLSLYIDKLKSMSEEDFWDQFDKIAEESHGKVEANHYQARLTIAYDSLLKRGIKTEENRLGILSSMIEHAERCDIRVVEAKSVSDYLDRYYKRERRSPILLDKYEEEYIREGYVHTSHHDNVIGAHIYWPNLPEGYWESTPEVREHRNLVETIVGEPTIITESIKSEGHILFKDGREYWSTPDNLYVYSAPIENEISIRHRTGARQELGTREDYTAEKAPTIITGYPSDKWDEVQSIQDQPFIYIMSNGHGRNDPDDLQYLLDLFSREPLDMTMPFITENPHISRREYDEDGESKWVDGDRMYEADGVYSFFGNFSNYSHVFNIHTNHRPTIRVFKEAVKANEARDWDNTEPIPDVLTSREEKYYSVDSAVKRGDEIDKDREQRAESKQNKPKVFRKKTAHTPITLDDTDYLDDL